jgi:hypothetical protein
MMQDTDSSTPDTSAATETPDETPKGTVRIDVERLTLPWLTQYDQRQFTQALQSQLARLAANYDSSFWSNLTDARIDRLDVAEQPAGTSPEELARRIAAGLFEKLSGIRGVQPHV